MTHTPLSFGTSRRKLLQAGAAGLGVLAAPAIVRAQAGPKLRIGFWPVAAGLPFFAAVEKGYFKEAGLDVEPLKFAGAQQVMEAMLSGRSDGSSNGTGSANLAIGEIAQPGLFKIFCTNPSNAKFVLDEFITGKDSPIKTMADLKGKKVASGPGIQNVTLCKTMLERAGACWVPPRPVPPSPRSVRRPSSAPRRPRRSASATGPSRPACRSSPPSKRATSRRRVSKWSRSSSRARSR